MGPKSVFEFTLVHLRSSGNVAPPRFGVQFRLGLPAFAPVLCGRAAPLAPLRLLQVFTASQSGFKELTMRKILTMTAVALAAAVPAAYAQTSTSDTRAAATVATSSTMIQPDEVRASKMIGSTIYDVQNRNIGSVKDL